MPELTVSSGVRLVFDDVGEGEPLLLIPGTGQGATLWALQVPCYSERYRCIVLDNRGAGRSDVPDDGYTMAQMADDAAAVLGSLGIERAHVSGQSMGSAVAQELALSRPDLVASLQLHSTWDQPFPHLVRQVRLRQELARRELWDLFAMNSVLALFTPEFANEHADLLVEREQQLFANPPAARGLVGHYEADIQHHTRGRLDADPRANAGHVRHARPHDAAGLQPGGARADRRRPSCTCSRAPATSPSASFPMTSTP